MPAPTTSATLRGISALAREAGEGTAAGCSAPGAGISSPRRCWADPGQALMNGLTAASTLSLVSALSNALGAGEAPFLRRIAAACRASTWTIVPAADRTSLDAIDGAAPLYALTPGSSS